MNRLLSQYLMVDLPDTFYSFFGNLLSYALLIVPVAMAVRHLKQNPDLIRGATRNCHPSLMCFRTGSADVCGPQLCSWTHGG